MKWFKKKIKSVENPAIKPDNPCLGLEKVCEAQADEILKLEKEAVYWKDKALNFRRFHQ